MDLGYEMRILKKVGFQMKKMKDFFEYCWDWITYYADIGFMILFAIGLLGGLILGISALMIGDKQDKILASPKELLVGTVTDVVNGNTIIVDFGESKRTVRLVGTKIPEPEESDRPITAVDFTKESLLGQPVSLEVDLKNTDMDKRLLAYVYLADGELFNKTVLEQGYAKLSVGLLTSRYKDEMKKAQTQAKLKGLGVWSNDED